MQFILLGLMLISSTVLALYPAANYDSIVKSSILIHRPEHHHHQQNHVINRNGAFLITNFKKPEQPHRALVIHKPVLITSLSNKPATIIETHKNHEAVKVKHISNIPCDEDKVKKIIVTQKQPIIVYNKPEKHVTTEKPVVHHEEKHVDEPVKFTINIEQPKPSVPVVTKEIYAVHRPNVAVPFGYNVYSNQPHSQLFFNKVQQPTSYYYGYPPQVQPVPQQFGYGYAVYGTPSLPRLVHKPNFEYIPKPDYEYGVPKENATVSFVPKQIPQYTSHQNIVPLPVRNFGYSFTAPIQPAPQKVFEVPNYEYGVPKPHNVYQPIIKPAPLRQFGYSFVAPEKPVFVKPVNVPKPSYEYGVPKENVIENNEIQRPQKFGYSYTIHNQPAIGIPAYSAPKLIQPVPKPSTEYGVPKLIQPVPKPSTEYGVPKVSNFGPIVVAPFDALASAPFARNQHLPIVGKHIQFTSS